ncbi:unnamed protein product [Penicillium nalgiovense]|nr:unnamed protein product [Penicillium nalgiovense]
MGVDPLFFSYSKLQSPNSSYGNLSHPHGIESGAWKYRAFGSRSPASTFDQYSARLSTCHQ